MEHIKDAQTQLDQGNSQKALAILDNLLDLAPKNAHALGLKARILESWGRFDDALKTLHALSRLPSLDQKAIDQIRECANEERQVFLFTHILPEGRLFYPVPITQILISFIGMLGCLAFLTLIPNVSPESVGTLIFSFLGLVVLPWVIFLGVSLKKIKKIFTYKEGLTIYKAFRKKVFLWKECHVVIRYSQEIKKDLLQLEFYTKQDSLNGQTKLPLLSLNINKYHPAIWARRHFLRTVLAHTSSYVYECQEDNSPDFNKAMVKEINDPIVDAEVLDKAA